MISKVLLFVGIACLALYGFFVVQAHWQQAELEKELYRPHPVAAASGSVCVRAGAPSNAALTGRRFIRPARDPAFEHVGDGDGRRCRPYPAARRRPHSGNADGDCRTSRHILPAAERYPAVRYHPHYDAGRNRRNITSFRHKSSVRRTPPCSTKSSNELTLITCYPFYYIGPAPKRFIVQAVKN